MSVQHSVLRGNKWCIKGHDCRHKVQALTVFCLDCWTRQKGKCKGNDLKERKEKIRRREFSNNKGNVVTRQNSCGMLSHIGSTSKVVRMVLFGGE